jgi:hypothetical protein
VVFTIPSELNRLVSMNRKVMYDLLFRSVSATLMELANDPKHLGARIGAIGILHTWGQNLTDHPHIHCIVTGGRLSADGGRWVPCRKDFFIPVRVMSALFRGKFFGLLKKCFCRMILHSTAVSAISSSPGTLSFSEKTLSKKVGCILQTTLRWPQRCPSVPWPIYPPDHY